MFANPYSQDLQMAATVIGYINRFNGQHDQANLDGLLVGDLGGPVNSVITPWNGNYPETYVGQSQGVTVIFIDHTETIGQAISLNNGYYLLQGGGFTGTTNRYLEGFPAYLGPYLSGSHFQNFGKVVIFGYSLGGALAYILADWFRKNTNASEPFVLTFGSPKPRDRALAATFSGRFGTRWMASNDPVPNYPFNAGAVSILNPILAFNDLVFVNNFAQPGGGRVIQSNGSSFAAEDNNYDQPISRLDFATWLLNLTSSGVHAASTYQQYLQLAADNNGGLSGGGEWFPDEQLLQGGSDWGGGAEVPVAIAGPAVNAMERAVTQTVFQRAVGQQAVEPSIPAVQAFTVARQGRLWYVYFGQLPIAVAPSKRRARRLALDGNAWLRKLLQQGVVDPDALVQQMTLWVQAAQDPTSGIQPLMNVSQQ